ncbi:hypothetical protein LR48_Vigan07g048700 [Vigna angularis]|uniref:Uncharacterized protein n=1 Tax=Phaseolus angularis TaxID=3914 RepID=A0A0L9UVJ4_PHAAN|nr:hypothetical protein LR48_Vigan07g048700 [Vigna angularis]
MSGRSSSMQRTLVQRSSRTLVQRAEDARPACRGRSSSAQKRTLVKSEDARPERQRTLAQQSEDARPGTLVQSEARPGTLVQQRTLVQQGTLVQHGTLVQERTLVRPAEALGRSSIK